MTLTPAWWHTSIEAARRGATVRLLLDSRHDEGDNQGTADYVNGIATYGLAPDFEFKGSDPAVPDMMPVNGRIGWGNGGDEAILRDVSGADVDVVIYGSGSYPGATPHPGVGGGNSLERKPAARDTDDCSADFWELFWSRLVLVSQPLPTPDKCLLSIPTRGKM